MSETARATQAWTDLADNQPGQLVRAHADALYADWRSRPLLRRLVTSRREELAVRRDADGQRQVARQFERLGSGWRVLHAVPAGGDGSIDHLLIGPGGVFIANARHHASKTVWLGGDTLMVDGRRVHHVRDSLHDAAEVSGLLSRAVGFDVPVTALVVIVGDKRFDVSHQSDECAVRVTTPWAAVRWLRRQGTEWTDYGADRIFEHARRSTTWEGVAEPSTTGVLSDDPAPADADEQAGQPGLDERAAS